MSKKRVMRTLGYKDTGLNASPADAAVRTYGCHFQVDALGSREIDTK